MGHRMVVIVWSNSLFAPHTQQIDRVPAYRAYPAGNLNHCSDELRAACLATRPLQHVTIVDKPRLLMKLAGFFVMFLFSISFVRWP